jgi:hypothetical protein
MPDIDDTVTHATEKKTWTLPKLREFDGQLFVQNNTPAYITFREKIGDKSVDFELEPAGEPDSITFLPKLALDMRGLQKLWMKGSITISTDPEMEDQIMLANAQAVGVSEARMREIMGKQTENENNKDLEEKKCLECGVADRTTGVITRGRVLQPRRQVKDGVPPLCPEHQGLKNNFVPRLVQAANGEDHWEFDKMELTSVLKG